MCVVCVPLSCHCPYTARTLPPYRYVLEPLVDSYEEEASVEVRKELMTAIFKLFFARPPECQQMLGRLLQKVVDDDAEPDLHDRGLLYYRLLQYNVDVAKQVVCRSVGIRIL